MKHDTTFRDGISACLTALHRLLERAASDTAEACRHIAANEQNTAVGTVMTVEEQLERSLTLYKAIVAMHRCKL